MAELATIARPYAEALLEAGVAVPEVHALAAVAGDARLRQIADHPKVGDELVAGIVTDVLLRKGITLSTPAANFLRTVIANGRIAALPEIARQLQQLADERSGVAQATVYSAYPLEGNALAQLTAVLEKRFGRKLQPTVTLDSSLIGGVRVVVGDEVLDTSVKARLEQMKAALTAA